jgi:hypothetical protein
MARSTKSPFGSCRVRSRVTARRDINQRRQLGRLRQNVVGEGGISIWREICRDCRQGWRRTGELALVLLRARERASCPLSIASKALILAEPPPLRQMRTVVMRSSPRGRR